ncbi:MAG: putative lysine decarboxylase, partial [Actinobacteria bacterium]|nr:putative lysine decarboxylase [Actinomycetota bacterium]
TLIPQGMVAADDLALMRFTHDVGEAADEITRFYANYHSQRYVDGRLVLRLLHPPTAEQLAQINDLFSDIVVSGVIESGPATPAEVEDGDRPDLPRLLLHFDRRSLGRLRALIDHLNHLAP